MLELKVPVQVQALNAQLHQCVLGVSGDRRLHWLGRCQHLLAMLAASWLTHLTWRADTVRVRAVDAAAA